MGAAVARRAVVLGDDQGQLVAPRLAAGRPQPRVLRADRGREVVQRDERLEVMEGGGDRELVVAVGLSGVNARANLMTR